MAVLGLGPTPIYQSGGRNGGLQRIAAMAPAASGAVVPGLCTGLPDSGPILGSMPGVWVIVVFLDGAAFFIFVWFVAGFDRVANGEDDK